MRAETLSERIPLASPHLILKIYFVSISAWAKWARIGLIVAGCVAFANSFSGSFVFDDKLSILENPTIRHWSTILFPPQGKGITVEGRPLLNATFALNWALSGPSPWSYHFVNLLIHVSNALLLFGILVKSLTRRRSVCGNGSPAHEVLLLSFAISVLWEVHPLQTESVTYIVQRAESLMALCFLLTLHCFIKYTTTPAPEVRRAWAAATLGACLLGMMAKEVMYAAPIVVLCYDAFFVSGSLGLSWRAHWRLHAGLFFSWLLLALLVFASGGRGSTVGFHIGVSPWQYAQTEFRSVIHYLRLIFWPHPLVFDYGTEWFHGWRAVAPAAAIIVTLVFLTVMGFRRWPAAAFCGVCFFTLLAPTSSIVPGNRQTTAEHRMYLPLAAVLALVILGGVRTSRRFIPSRTRTVLWGSCALAIPLAAMTIRRNCDYESEEILYRDTALKKPANAFNRYNLGKALDENGDKIGALAEYQAAIGYDPSAAQVYDNLGNTLADLGRSPEAEVAYRTALRLRPNHALAHYNLGTLLLREGRKSEAAEQFSAVVLLEPENIDARDNLGGVLLELGRMQEAETQLRAAARRPSVETFFNLGVVYATEGRFAEAREQFEACLRLRPGFKPAMERLALIR